MQVIFLLVLSMAIHFPGICCSTNTDERLLKVVLLLAARISYPLNNVGPSLYRNTGFLEARVEASTCESNDKRMTYARKAVTRPLGLSEAADMVAPRPSRTENVMMSSDEDWRNEVVDRRKSRATRRQKFDGLKDSGTLEESLEEAVTDRRAGWRANKAKGKRRNRRYEKRLLQGFNHKSVLLGDEY